MTIERIPELKWSGDRLLRAREARKAKRRHLALALDVHADLIRKWEENQNTPNGATVARLTMYFGVDATAFFEEVSADTLVTDTESRGGAASRDLLDEAKRLSAGKPKRAKQKQKRSGERED